MIRPNQRACLSRRFARDARGAVSIIAALMIVLALGLSVLVIDAGHLYLAKRRLQSAVDAAALAAAGDTVQAAVLAGNSLAANGYDRTATIETGIYTADPALAASARFAPAATDANAVRVTKTVETPTFLAGIFGMGQSSGVKASATAARIPAVSFAAGTSVTEVDADQLNQMLGGLFQVGALRGISYDALASADIDALPFLDQLAARTGVTAGTYGDLANASVTLGQMLAAATAVLNIQGGGNNAAVDALNLLSLQLPQSASMTLGQVIDAALWRKREIGSVVQQDSGQTRINLLDMVTAAARVYGAGHLVSVSSGATIPLAGAVTVTTNLVVGSPMTGVALSPAGTSISTAQVRAAVTIRSNTRIPLGVGSFTVTLPVYVRLGGGTATATRIPCVRDGIRATITAGAQAGLARIGTVVPSDLVNSAGDPPIGPAALAAIEVKLPLVTIPVSINVGGTIPIAEVTGQPLDFTQALIDAGTPRTAAGSNSGHIFTGLTNPAIGFSFPPAGAVTDLLNATLNTLVLPLVTPLLSALLTALDPIIDALLRALGLRLGVIDVMVRGVSCGAPTLVH